MDTEVIAAGGDLPQFAPEREVGERRAPSVRQLFEFAWVKVERLGQSGQVTWGG